MVGVRTAHPLLRRLLVVTVAPDHHKSERGRRVWTLFCFVLFHLLLDLNMSLACAAVRFAIKLISTDFFLIFFFFNFDPCSAFLLMWQLHG